MIHTFIWSFTWWIIG